MKKITFLFAFLSVAFFANAQSNNEEVDFYQSIFGMEKKAVVADFLNLEESNPFWALYDEYEAREKNSARIVFLPWLFMPIITTKWMMLKMTR